MVVVVLNLYVLILILLRLHLHPPRPKLLRQRQFHPPSSTPSARRMPTIPVDPKPSKGVIRSSTSSITLPSSISSTALFPPLKLQPNLIRKINNEYELRTEKSDQVYILSCIHEQTKLSQWKNVFQSPLLAIQATKHFIALVTFHETHHCSELFLLERQSGLRLYSNIVLTQTLAALYISENTNHIQRATISLIYITGSIDGIRYYTSCHDMSNY